MGATPLKAVTNRFPQAGGNRATKAFGVIFTSPQRARAWTPPPPPPNDSSIASLSLPVGGCLCSFRRDWKINKCSDSVLNIITNVLPFISKPNLVRAPDSFRLQGPSQRTSSGLLHPVSFIKEQSPASSPQASPKVEASDRPKQAQHLPTCRKVHNGNSRVHQGLSACSRPFLTGLIDFVGWDPQSRSISHYINPLSCDMPFISHFKDDRKSSRAT